MAKGNRRFTLTINNDEIVSRDDAKEYALSLLKDKYKDLVYVVIGRECAPSTGKVHLHVYVEFDNQKSEVQLRKVLGNAHSEVYTNMDNGAKAYQYATKEDSDALEYGKRKFDVLDTGTTERKANGYQGAIDLIYQGAPLREVVQTYPEIALRHYNALRSIYNDFGKRPSRDYDERTGEVYDEDEGV